MLATQYLMLMQQGTVAATPLSSWEFFKRTKRQVDVEAVAFPVDDFISQVKEPTESEIKDLYEEEIHSGKLVLKESDWKQEWQGYHKCIWDNFESYYCYPCDYISAKYVDPEEEDPEKLALMKQAKDDVWEK